MCSFSFASVGLYVSLLFHAVNFSFFLSYVFYSPELGTEEMFLFSF